MYAGIIIECQSKIDKPNCEYCIADKTFRLRKEFEGYPHITFKSAEIGLNDFIIEQ